MPPIRRRGDLQLLADRLDPVHLPVLVNIGVHFFNSRICAAWAKKALADFKISLARRSSLTSRSSYRHEPALALAGGADGMTLIKRILADAPRYLQPDGILVLEIGHEANNFHTAFPHIEPPESADDCGARVLQSVLNSDAPPAAPHTPAPPPPTHR